MKISRSFLQTYFKEPLPPTEKLVEGLTMHSFEIEGVERAGNDEVLDVKVLPNRAHDCLSHYGIAKEVSAVFGKSLLKKPFEAVATLVPETDSVIISVETKKVPRFSTALICGVRVGPSPSWLKERLEAIGQKSINNIVDITNYVMFDLGQPIHAFDLDKLSNLNGKIAMHVRETAKNEEIETLDDKTYVLPEETIVITDSERIVGIGGIKGGKTSQISNSTKDILLEAANFNGEAIRKTSKLLSLRTDASVRFENSIAQELPTYALRLAIDLIHEIAGGTLEGFKEYNPVISAPYKVGASLRDINSLLGTNLKENDIENILSRYNFAYEKVKPSEAIRAHIDEVLGKPYKNPSSMRFDAPHSFSCSSLVSYLYVFGGIYMPSISIDKYLYGDAVEEKDLRFGDLIFSNTGKGKIRTETVEYMPGTKVPEGIDHVALYLEDGKVLHAGSSRGVVTDSLEEYKKSSPIVGFRRMAENLNEERFVVTVPFERLDIRGGADLIEEIGRLYGLVNIPTQRGKNNAPFEISKNQYYGDKIRRFLKENGFSEVSTYSMQDVGEREIENPLAQDKNYMRASLGVGLARAMELNLRNAPLLGLQEIQMFEIGKVFPKGKESLSLSVAIGFPQNAKKKERLVRERLEQIITDLGKHLGISFRVSYTDSLAFVSLDEVIEGMPMPKAYEKIEEKKISRYEAPSAYPFVLRDIAIFVPEDTSPEKIKEIIKKEGGELLKRTDLFDEFKKEERISYAFRLVFQSKEKTLSDGEVNDIMSRITASLEALKNWQVR